MLNFDTSAYLIKQIQKQTQQSFLQQKEILTNQETHIPKFNWLNPPNQYLDTQKVKNILSNLQDQDKQTLLQDESFLKFFQDDMRALSLYLSVVPVVDLKLGTQDDEKLIDISQYNTFFQQNYIFTQAYKLSFAQIQAYTQYQKQNGFITWQDYVKQTLQKNSFQSLSDPQNQPNFSINYFLSDLTPDESIPYLERLSQDTTPESQSQKKLYDEQQFSNILKTKLQSGLTPQNPLLDMSQPETSPEQISFNTSPKLVKPPQVNTSNTNPNPKIIDNKLEGSAISSSYSNYSNLSPESFEVTSLNQTSIIPASKPQKNPTTTDQLTFQGEISSNPYNQTILPQIERIQIQQKQQQEMPNFKNYAKIIGYSTAGILGGISSGLTFIMTLLSENL